MKYFFLIFILIIACESPFDVSPSEGDKKVIDDPYLKNPILAFDIDTLNFGMILPSDIVKDSVTVFNISDKVVNIDSAEFYNDIFNVEIKPFKLDKKDDPEDSKQIGIYFQNEKSGIYKDSMIIDNMYRPTLYTQAKIPDVFGRDVDFGIVEINEISGSFIKIENISNQKVIINNIELLNNELFNFSKNPELPFEISPQSFHDILVRFQAANVGNFSDTVEISINNDLILKKRIILRSQIK